MGRGVVGREGCGSRVVGRGVVGRGVVGRGGCGSRVEGRGLWVRVRGGRGGCEGNHHFIYYQENTLKPNVFDKRMKNSTAKHLSTSLDTPHGDGRRRNQLHLPSPVYITYHLMSHKLPVARV